MGKFEISIVGALLAGVFAFATLEACGGLLRSLTGTPGVMMDPPPFPWWSHVAQMILNSLQLVGPGLLAGWLSQRSGWMVGAIVGFVGQFAAWGVQLLYIGTDFLATFEAPWVLGLVIASSITAAVGGAAGVALRRSTPSNPRVENDAVARLTRTR